MEWLLLCLGEDDGEERIKHEVHYVYVVVLVHLFRVTSLKSCFLFIVFKSYLHQGCCWWCLWYSALFVQCPGELSCI